MPRIADILTQASGPTLSVEFFPPKTPVGDANLQQTIEDLRPVPLSFVSVTYGAGGSTRDRTRDLVVDINEHESYPAMAHLTCIGHTKPELEALLDDYDRAGVHNILALAGDPPADGSPADGDFTYALELVELVRARGDHFSVSVAAHPELHPRSEDTKADRLHLARKLAVADFGITQFFFSAPDYFRMVDELSALGCDTPILPGIMPLTNPEGVRRMAKMSGATVPEDLAVRVEGAGSVDEAQAIAVEAALELSHELLNGGAPGLHLYGLNKSEIVLRLVDQLNLL